MNLKCTGFDPEWGMSRRRFLNGFGMGMGAIGLSDLLRTETQAGDVSICDWWCVVRNASCG